MISLHAIGETCETDEIEEIIWKRGFRSYSFFLFILIIGYSGLSRISEILGIKLSNIVITSSFMSISVPKRKNDQQMEGHISVLARSRKLTCPVSITEKFLSLLPLQDPKASLPIICRIVKTKKQECFHDFLSISNTTALDTIRKFIAPIVSQPTKQFATHAQFKDWRRQ